MADTGKGHKSLHTYAERRMVFFLRGYLTVTFELVSQGRDIFLLPLHALLLCLNF